MIPEKTRVLRREQRKAFKKQPPRRRHLYLVTTPYLTAVPSMPDRTDDDAALARLTNEAVELTELAAGLNDRTIPWTEWNDELRTGLDDKQEVAAEEAAVAARDAWNRLDDFEGDDAA